PAVTDLNPAGECRSVAEQFDVDSAQRGLVVEPDGFAEATASVTRECDVCVSLIVLHRVPRDGDVAPLRAQRRTVDRAGENAPGVRMYDCRITPATVCEARHVDVSNLVVAPIAVRGDHTVGGHDGRGGTALTDAWIHREIGDLFPCAVERGKPQGYVGHIRVRTVRL